MANKPLKSIKYPGLPDTYTFLQNDPTLTQSGQAADAKVVGDEIATKVSKPTSSPNGTAGQLLRTNGDGTTQWVDQGLPTDEQTAEAVTSWLTDHPEATTTVQDGSITEAKLANNVYLDKYINLSAIPASDIPLSNFGIDSTDGYTMQGACYNADNNHIVIAFHKANNPVCIVKELDADWNLVKTASLTLYHANDITYNPNTGLYYVADGENSNTIYSVNSALTVVTTITVNVGGIIGQISYDENNDRYYILSNSKEVYTCDNSFGNITYYATLNTANDYQSIQTIYIGGSCMCGNSFVSLLWFYSTYDQVTSYTRLCFANADKVYDGYFFDFKSQSVGDEAEALVSMPDKMVSVGYTSGGVATRMYIYKNGYQSSGMMCLLGNTYRNVNYVPVNSYGICTILASSSPTSADITGAYICYGNGQNKTLRITVNDTDYYRYCYGIQQWTAWHSNKEILNSLIVSEAKTIATGVSINANTSSSEYVIDINAKSGYVPFLATHRESSSPVVFPWYCYLVTSATATSGYAIKARYRNTFSTEQTNVNLSAFVFYVKKP